MPLSHLADTINNHLSSVFGRCLALQLRVNDRNPPVYIGSAPDYPAKGMVTLSTIGVSSYPLYGDDGAIYAPTRVEFVASCQKGQDDDLILALRAAAEFVIHQKGFVRPGIFLFNLIGQVRRESTVPHAFLTSPFAYEGLKEHGPFGGTVVSWLQVIPVATSEIDFAMLYSTEDLEDLFVKEDIDWDRLDRPPVV